MSFIVTENHEVCTIVVQTWVEESEDFMKKEITEKRIEEVVSNAFIKLCKDIALEFANMVLR